MFAMSRARLLVALIVWLAFATVLALYAFSSTASANHSWSDFHWGNRPGLDGQTQPFTLSVENNLTQNATGNAWGGYLRTASSATDPAIKDWSDSTKLDTTIVNKQSWTSTCPATSGQVKVCNKEYGSNGWLGLATVWASDGHITQGTAKMNDTYFKTSKYNKAGWKHLVMCQEVGHTFGLAHTDENNSNANLGSCMDYSGDPDGDGVSSTPDDNRYPGGDDPGTTGVVETEHDYDQLKTIYAHTTDTTTTVGSASAASRMPPAAREINTADPRQRGQLVSRSARGEVEVYERDFGNGNKVITRVIRAVDGTPTLEADGRGGGVDGGTHDHHDHDH
jgi:hypothetical protein